MQNNAIHLCILIFTLLCMRFAIAANNGVNSKHERMECVNPRWANKLLGVSNHISATTSISGKVCASAPQSMALRPSSLPAITSPMQAPNTMCVIESISIHLLCYFGEKHLHHPYKICRQALYLHLPIYFQN